jgi:hypothetical protein
MGGIFESDGRLKGTRVTQTIQCDPNTGQYTIGRLRGVATDICLQAVPFR